MTLPKTFTDALIHRLNAACEARKCDEECVAAGRKAKGRRSAGKAVCEMCGREFERYTRRQRLCHECSARTHGNGDRRKNED